MTQTLLMLGLLLAGANAPNQAQITLIDAETGQWLAGEIEIQALEQHHHGQDSGRLLALPSQPPLSPNLANGRYQLTARASGYQPLQTTIRWDPKRIERLWFELPRLRTTDASDLKATPQDTISGYLSRAEDGLALAGASVRLKPYGVSTKSDQNGFFQLALPERTDEHNLSLQISSHERHTRLAFATPPLPGLRLRLAVAEGDDLKFLPAPMAWRDDPPKNWPGPWTQSPLAATPERPGIKAGISEDGRPVLPAAASIRVGDQCSGRQCSEVRVMALEDYVAGGLPDEWIASWHFNSLRAGAVAYRSYAAWHIANPINEQYDICNSTSCQVWSPGRHPRTDQAVADTAGILLNLPAQPHAFRAEYAAENNNLLGDRPCSNLFRTCGDGFVGSPGADWPCLDDRPVATGQSCFGHGRGMSQWGTQGWALLDRSWPDIVNHYYNASGGGAHFRRAVMTRPFETGALSLSQQRIGPGSRLKIQWPTQLNEDNWPLNALMGASLRCGDGWIDDTANDTPVRIPAGAGRVARTFRLNRAVPGSQCDLMVALYADGNDNGQIDGDDLLLVRRTETAVIAVDTDQLFRDEFRR